MITCLSKAKWKVELTQAIHQNFICLTPTVRLSSMRCGAPKRLVIVSDLQNCCSKDRFHTPPWWFFYCSLKSFLLYGLECVKTSVTTTFHTRCTGLLLQFKSRTTLLYIRVYIYIYISLCMGVLKESTGR